MNAARAKRGISRAGLGAAWASLLGIILSLAGVTSPPILLGLVILGAIFGVIVDALATTPDDDFPDAPPPRLGM